MFLPVNVWCFLLQKAGADVLFDFVIGGAAASLNIRCYRRSVHCLYATLVLLIKVDVEYYYVDIGCVDHAKPRAQQEQNCLPFNSINQARMTGLLICHFSTSTRLDLARRIISCCDVVANPEELHLIALAILLPSDIII